MILLSKAICLVVIVLVNTVFGIEEILQGYDDGRRYSIIAGTQTRVRLSRGPGQPFREVAHLRLNIGQGGYGGVFYHCPEGATTDPDAMPPRLDLPGIVRVAWRQAAGIPPTVPHVRTDLFQITLEAINQIPEFRALWEQMRLLVADPRNRERDMKLHVRDTDPGRQGAWRTFTRSSWGRALGDFARGDGKMLEELRFLWFHDPPLLHLFVYLVSEAYPPPNQQQYHVGGAVGDGDDDDLVHQHQPEPQRAAEIDVLDYDDGRSEE